MRWYRALNPFGDDGRSMKLTTTISNAEINANKLYLQTVYTFPCADYYP